MRFPVVILSEAEESVSSSFPVILNEVKNPFLQRKNFKLPKRVVRRRLCAVV